MSAGRKPVAIIVAIVGGVAVLSVILIGIMEGISLWSRSHAPSPGYTPAPAGGRIGQRPLATDRVAITMHDESALARQFTVEKSLRCRIRMPGMFQETKRSLDSTGQMEIAVGNDGRALSVRREALATLERTKKFDTFVRIARDYPEGGRLTHVVIESEGQTSIGGLNGYVVTYRCRYQDMPFMMREVWLDGRDGFIYILKAVAREELFSGFADTVDSAFSTFQLGDDFNG
jgi:hypothetical protein